MYSTTLTVADLERAGLHAESMAGKGTANRQRAYAPLGAIVHSPGITFATRAFDRAQQALGRRPAPAEFDMVAARSFDALLYQPNYLIGTSGKVYQLDLDCQRALHSGMLASDCPAGNVYETRRWREWAHPLGGRGWVQHGRPGDRVYDWWVAAFPGADGPMQVFPWGRYPNNAVGVDVLPDPANHGEFNAAQRSSYLALVRLLAQAHNFKIGATTVTTHSFASPLERGSVMRSGKVIGIHWDPPTDKGWDHADNLAVLEGT